MTISTSARARGLGAHHRPLAGVPVAAGAEHHDQPARQPVPDRVQHRGQRRRLVRVVDHRQEVLARRPPAPSGRAPTTPASASAACCTSRPSASTQASASGALATLNAPGMARSSGHRAGSARAARRVTCWTPGGRRPRPRRPTSRRRRRRSQTVSASGCAAASRAPYWVSMSMTCRLGAAVEQQALGPEVLLHVVVEVQVVLATGW